MIAINGLTHTFGATTALADVDLEIASGECLGLVGPPGSGRTTLLRILATLVRPTAGRIEIDGLDVAADVYRVRPLVAYAGRDRIAGNGLRVDEHLRLVAAARKRPVSSIPQSAALVGLDPRAPIATLTIDAHPRLALAAALIAAPAILLLDEPFHAVETAALAGLLQWLRAARDGGATIVVSAGTTDDLSQVCRRVARLEAGQVVELSTLHRPAARPPAELVGA